MSSKMLKGVVAAALAAGLLAGTAQAYEAGDWLFRIGAYGVFPETDNLTNVLGTGATLNVEDGYTLGFNFTYMINPNIGVELLAALPFQHDIKLSGVGQVGQTDQLPPTVSIQYHFMPQNSIRPYVGLGINYTFFFNEETSGALTGTSLSLDSSWGLAGQVGIDIDVAPNWFVNADLRYIGIDTEAKLDRSQRHRHCGHQSPCGGRPDRRQGPASGKSASPGGSGYCACFRRFSPIATRCPCRHARSNLSGTPLRIIGRSDPPAKMAAPFRFCIRSTNRTPRFKPVRDNPRPATPH